MLLQVASGEGAVGICFLAGRLLAPSKPNVDNPTRSSVYLLMTFDKFVKDIETEMNKNVSIY